MPEGYTPYILEHNAEADKGYEQIWIVVRDLTRADFQIGEWHVFEPKADERWYKQQRASATVVLTFVHELETEVRGHEYFFRHLFAFPNHRRDDSPPVRTLSADLTVEVKYQGARNEAQQKARFERALEAVRKRVEQRGNELIDDTIDQFNKGIQSWLERKRLEFLQKTVGWATRVDGYDKEALDEEAGVTAIKEQIAILEAQAEGLRDLAHQKRVAVIRKAWEAGSSFDKKYPELVSQAVRNHLNESGARKPQNIRILGRH